MSTTATPNVLLAPMPSARSSSAPRFEGKEVTTFLTSIVQHGANAGIADKDQLVSFILDYSTEDVRKLGKLRHRVVRVYNWIRPLYYVLLFPYGEPGWHPDLRLNEPDKEHPARLTQTREDDPAVRIRELEANLRKAESALETANAARDEALQQAESLATHNVTQQTRATETRRLEEFPTPRCMIFRQSSALTTQNGMLCGCVTHEQFTRKMELVLPHVITTVEVELGCFCGPLQAVLGKREILNHTVSGQISIRTEYKSSRYNVVEHKVKQNIALIVVWIFIIFGEGILVDEFLSGG
ncbi:hypothetical protein B0H14DRAFT_3647070 [Mycena olivaceomarginata]|nr:hypothetical protein B0H14DRAFT_3647070 [Mycena olivaceomarginata]